MLTILTILLAWPSPPEVLGALVRPAYFALLFWFFWHTGRSPELKGQAMRLVSAGFLVLWLSFTCGAIVRLAGLEPMHASFAYLRHACEHGAMFLLGTTLSSYGLMLWIPEVLHSHRVLGEHVARQSGRLEVAASTQSRLEQRLIDADRRALLGELAATIAHDLRNPLTIVKGTAESLCRRPRTAAEVAEHTDVIRRSIEKADRAIAALIDLGRPRAGAASTRTARELLEEVLSLVSVEARRRNLHLEILVDRRSGEPTVHADHALLTQALLNLVLNAVQATADGGRIALRARSFAGVRGGTVLAIEDRGHGLPPAVRERLFTPFFTTKATGTGLGLSSCRRIAKELGGALDLYPRRRGGARAVMLLPAGGAVPPHDAYQPGARECLASNC